MKKLTNEQKMILGGMMVVFSVGALSGYMLGYTNALNFVSKAVQELAATETIASTVSTAAVAI